MHPVYFILRYSFYHLIIKAWRKIKLMDDYIIIAFHMGRKEMTLVTSIFNNGSNGELYRESTSVPACGSTIMQLT